MRPVADFVWNFIFYSVPLVDAELPLIVVWLIAGGVFFTVYLGFVNVRGFRHACSLLTGKYADPDHPGEISQFQALTTAVSGTVGIGNIAGIQCLKTAPVGGIPASTTPKGGCPVIG